MFLPCVFMSQFSLSSISYLLIKTSKSHEEHGKNMKHKLIPIYNVKIGFKLAHAILLIKIEFFPRINDMDNSVQWIVVWQSARSLSEKITHEGFYTS